ncbi:GGDEF domain-containing protein [Faecalibacillus faecis]|uniref:GGDEF domain-containing protein n=1 Tax=Faecalibacillus faecis TaxID=1982628 RepID=UPI002F941FE6
MTYKIAFFSSDWLFEIVQEKQNAINQFLNDYQDIFIDMFETFGNYGLVHPMDSLLELYKLPNIKDYDVLIFQTNSNFYKDYRQQMIEEAHKYHIPVISINDPIKDCVYVGTDNQQAIYKLTQTILAERNCQKVAYVSGPMSSREARLRKAGFLQATKDLEDIQIIEGNWNTIDGQIAGEKLFNHLPELVVCANDNLAHGVIVYFQQKGLEVGKDVYVTGFDNITIAKASSPRITTISRDYHTITYTALKTARDLIMKKKISIVYTPFKIIKGASCGYPINEKDDYDLKKEYLSYTYHSNCFFESTERLEILLSEASNFYDLLDVFEKESQNFGYKQIYLMMNSKYIDEMSENITYFSKTMYLMAMTYPKSSPDTKHIYQEFSKDLILPQEYKSRYMIYTSLSNNGVAIGYLAFDNYSKNISINYMTIILKLLGLTIESIRKKQVLSSLNEKLESLYVKDSLTHLYNRFGMNQYGRNLYQQLIQKDKQALIYFIDMDYMKKINDVYGHDMGDSAIKELSSIILNTISKDEIAIRYGGDEFIIVADALSIHLPQKIKEGVNHFNQSKTHPYTLSVSIGYFQANQNDDFEFAINQADTLMYQIKKEKKAQR